MQTDNENENAMIEYIVQRICVTKYVLPWCTTYIQRLKISAVAAIDPNLFFPKKPQLFQNIITVFPIKSTNQRLGKYQLDLLLVRCIVEEHILNTCINCIFNTLINATSNCAITENLYRFSTF